jgi:Pyridoxamine 5'-phosphate oxidase
MISPTMFSWADFERAAPDLASLGRERFERFGIVLIGTVRSDGGPRVTPVEVYLVQGHLVFNMMWRSLKALDLLRDPRVFVHSVVTGREGAEGEFKLRGHAVVIEDARLRAASADAIEAAIDWRPPERSHFFAVAVEAAAFVHYEDDERRMTRWNRERGLF